MKIKTEHQKPLKRFIAVGLVLTLGGSMLAASASDSIQPREIELGAAYSNAPAEIPTVFARGTVRATLSDDSSVKAIATGSTLQVYRYGEGQEKLFELKPTAECTHHDVLATPIVSGDGSRVVFFSTSNYLHCLNGSPAPAEKSATLWGLEYSSSQRTWVMRPINVDTQILSWNSMPAITQDGKEVFFASNVTPEGSDLSATSRQIYGKNLETGAVRMISNHFKLNPAGRTDARRIIASANGRYVGWQESDAFRSSKMFSDEAQRSIDNIVIMEVGTPAGAPLEKDSYALVTVPTVSPLLAQGSYKRQGTLLRIVATENGAKIYYNTESASSNWPSALDLRTHIYLTSERKMYSAGARLEAISPSGQYGVGDKRTYSLGSQPGPDKINFLDLNYVVNPSSSSQATGDYYFVNDNRAIHAGQRANLVDSAFELPLP